MRRFLSVAALLALSVAALSACTGGDDDQATPRVAAVATPTASVQGGTQTSTSTSAGAAPVATASASASAEDHDDPADYVWNTAGEVEIALQGTTATASGNGVRVSGATVTITTAGTYRLSGSLANGQVAVDSGDDKIVRIILDGVNITNSTQAAIAVTDAKKVMIVLADGSQNRLADGKTYTFPSADSDEPNAALFSRADLTITGNGALAVTGNFNDAISSKDGLVISGGTIAVDAADDGIRGKDYVVVRGGTISVEAGGDGIKADNDEDAALGYVAIESGTVTITSGGDAIDAETTARIADGKVTLTAGGGATTPLGADDSAKGIKGTASVVIDGGVIDINAADDGVHSNVNVTINGGRLTIATGDDGVHADTALVVNAGTIDVTRSYEGLESAALNINGGEISVTSSDDGINAAGGVDGSGTQGPGQRPGDRFGGTAGSFTLTINGGTILVTANGDGLDINGSVTMTGGTVVVQGPTANNNGAVDYGGTFTMSGGVLVAAGSAGMAQAPGAASSQASVLLRLSSVQQAGTLVHLQDSAGKTLLTFKASKAFQSLAFSSPTLANGTTYDIYLGGTATGTNLLGYYTDGSYSGGAKSGTVATVAR